MKRAVIVDYDIGNLFSVQQACRKVGLDSVISNKKSDLEESDAIILPGVGSFREAMNKLELSDLVTPVQKQVRNGKPFLGICLGMQLLFSESEEFGLSKGLDLIKGSVVRFPAKSSLGEKVRIPLINWSEISFPPGQDHFKSPLLKGIAQNECMYFVHSYYVVNDEPDTTACISEYAGIQYCSGISKDNIMAFQFHPEKSSESGLRIYNNFKNMIYNG
jgi:glutamine amidotransferase